MVRPHRRLRRERLTPRQPARSSTTLFDLGRQVTGVLDFDELLAQIPTLIARLIPFDAFAVYLLDERRARAARGLHGRLPGARRPVHAVARPGAHGCGRVDGGARSRQRRQLRSPLPPLRARHELGGRRAAAAQVEADRRAQHPEPEPRPVHRARRGHPAPVRRARCRGGRQRAAVRAQPDGRRRVRNARRHRPRGRLGSRSRRAVRPHRAAHPPRRRLPDVRHPAARRRDRASSR